MDIKLKARLSAYSRFPHKLVDKQCGADVVTKEDIDSLFGGTSVPETTQPSTELNSGCNSDTVSFADIDSLFN